MSFDPERVASFWSRVDRRGPDDCWEWQGSRRERGYGGFAWKGRSIAASRFSLCLKLGREMADEEMACHKCDNPPCCNPAHLWLGSHQDNILDASKKGMLWQNKTTHCPKGHPLSGDNLRIVKGNQRRCHACTIEYSKLRKRKVREAYLASIRAALGENSNV